jgi:hypothetical protein
MIITIQLSKFYDWEPAETPPSVEEIKSLRAKPGQNGEWLKRIEKAAPGGQTETYVNLPETEIQDCMAQFERNGNNKTRAKVVAWYIEEKIMPHHADISKAFLSAQVEGEPAVQAYLNKYFAVG